ncbi:MAG: PKD domain-containing protein [Candidatus Omnitrophota bacterium]
MSSNRQKIIKSLRLVMTDLFVFAIGLWFILASQQALLAQEETKEASEIEYREIGMVDGGPDILTYVNVKTEFKGTAISPDRNISKYTWDFNGDGTIDEESSITGNATHTYSKPGIYNAVLKAYDDSGLEFPEDVARVVVRAGRGQQAFILKRHLHRSNVDIIKKEKDTLRKKLNLSPKEKDFLEEKINFSSSEGYSLSEASINAISQSSVPDGIRKRYVLMINGGSESRFWDDVKYAYYDVFRNKYGIPDEDIYLLNYNGFAPDGQNPGKIIDYSATKTNLSLVCSILASKVDADDIVFLCVLDHGFGYVGPVQRSSSEQLCYGYLSGVASVDPGDEQDYLESNFKLRSLFTGGAYKGNHGMEEWRYYQSYKGDDKTYCYRHKYVSHFNNVNFTQKGLKSDTDIYIEEYIDYLNGDYNKDGIIDTAIGEIFDSDRDGIFPYDSKTKLFDEGDWGEIDTYNDDVKRINTCVPELYTFTYAILDYNLDNHVDIDLVHDPLHPEANGTDLDNVGLFDGLDINDDKDYDDWISIDEEIHLVNGDVTDDELLFYLGPINAQAIVVVMESCFSGGFVEDLSKANRIIMTATEEETISYGSRFIRNITSVFSGLIYPDSRGNPALADANHDGRIDMTEAFNFTAANDYEPVCEIPQYDDNGDKISHINPLPRDGDGNFGSAIFLDIDQSPPVIPLVTDEGQYTLMTDQLYASWVSSDLESGIAEYQYQITQDSTEGTIVRDWTPIGTYNYVTAGGLFFQNGKTYYFGVKAKNNVGLCSQIGYSDGIKVDNIAPTGTIKINNNTTYTTSTSVALDLSAEDAASGMGSGAQMRFSNDGSTWSNPEDYALSNSYVLLTGDGTKIVYVKFKDAAGNWSDAISDTIILAENDIPPVSFTITLTKGWNLISIPVELADMRASQIFQAGVRVKSMYPNEEYYDLDINEELKIGQGYWVKVPETKTYTFTGTPVKYYEYKINESGWYLLGSISGQGAINVTNAKIAVVYYLDPAFGYLPVRVNPDGIYHNEPCRGYVVDVTDVAEAAKITIILTALSLDYVTDVSAQALSSSQIKLTWKDNSSEETGFKIERGLSLTGPWVQVKEVGANVTTATDMNLAPDIVYYYRVYAYHSSGSSAYSNVVSTRTLK